MLIVAIPKSDFGPNIETTARASGRVKINGVEKEYQVSPGLGFWLRDPGTSTWDKRQILHASYTEDELIVFHCSNPEGVPTTPITMFRPDEQGRIIKTTIGGTP